MNNYQKGYTKILAITGLLSVAILTGYLLAADSDTATQESQIQTEISITGDKETGEQLRITTEGLETSNEIEEYRWNILETEGGGQINTDTGETLTYTFNEAGSKTIQLEIEDTEGYTENTNKIIEIDEEPIDEVYLNHLEPNEGEEIEGPRGDFEFYTEIPSDDTYNYEIQIGEETETITGQLSEGTQTITEEDIQLDDSGQNIVYTVNIQDSNDIEASETEQIEIGRAWNELGIEGIAANPGDGDDVDYNATFETEINELYNPVDWNLYINEQLETSNGISEQFSGTYSHTHEFEEPDTYNWQIQIESQETNEQINSSVKTLETTQEPPEEGEEEE